MTNILNLLLSNIDKKELKEYLENMKENNKKKYAKNFYLVIFLYFW
jgi:hypothetical protein